MILTDYWKHENITYIFVNDCILKTKTISKYYPLAKYSEAFCLSHELSFKQYQSIHNLLSNFQLNEDGYKNVLLFFKFKSKLKLNCLVSLFS